MNKVIAQVVALSMAVCLVSAPTILLADEGTIFIAKNGSQQVIAHEMTGAIYRVTNQSAVAMKLIVDSAAPNPPQTIEVPKESAAIVRCERDITVLPRAECEVKGDFDIIVPPRRLRAVASTLGWELTVGTEAMVALSLFPESVVIRVCNLPSSTHQGYVDGVEGYSTNPQPGEPIDMITRRDRPVTIRATNKDQKFEISVLYVVDE